MASTAISMYYSGMLDILLDQPLALDSAAHGRLPPEWSWTNTGADHWRGLVLWLICDGHGSMQCQGQRRDLVRGDVVLMRMDAARQGRHDPRRPMLVPWCVFDHRECPPASWAGLPATTYRRCRDIDFAAELLHRAISAHQEDRQSSVAVLWLNACLHELCAPPTQPLTGRSAHANAIDDLAEAMRRHPQRRHPVPALAARCGCDPDHFARLFRQRLGLPPQRYALRCRIDHARSLLRFGDLSVAEIAHRLGYSDPFLFSRQFKAITGSSPSDFRRGLEVSG